MFGSYISKALKELFNKKITDPSNSPSHKISETDIYIDPESGEDQNLGACQYSIINKNSENNAIK